MCNIIYLNLFEVLIHLFYSVHKDIQNKGKKYSMNKNKMIFLIILIKYLEK